MLSVTNRRSTFVIKLGNFVQSWTQQDLKSHKNIRPFSHNCLPSTSELYTAPKLSHVDFSNNSKDTAVTIHQANQSQEFICTRKLVSCSTVVFDCRVRLSCSTVVFDCRVRLSCSTVVFDCPLLKKQRKGLRTVALNFWLVKAGHCYFRLFVT